MRIRPLQLSCLLGLALLMAHQVQALSSTYEFDGRGLSMGQLVGQDNWQLLTAPSNDGLNVVNGSGVNSSLVAENPGTPAGQGNNWVTRQDGTGFSIADFTGTESSSYLEADIRAVPDDSTGSFWFYVGESGTGNISPWLGMGISVPDLDHYFLFRGAAGGTNTIVPTPVGIDQGDWVRVRLVMDFTAGLGDVYYRNLTDLDPGFTAVAGMQNLDLQFVPGVDPSDWDAMFLRSDEINSNAAIDNLTVFVPEPASSMLLLAGLTALGSRRFRKKRRAGQGAGAPQPSTGP